MITPQDFARAQADALEDLMRDEPVESPCPRILLGREAVQRLRAGWFKRVPFVFYEMPRRGDSELRRGPSITLACERDWVFFEAGQELVATGDGVTHYLLGQP